MPTTKPVYCIKLLMHLSIEELKALKIFLEVPSNLVQFENVKSDEIIILGNNLIELCLKRQKELSLFKTQKDKIAYDTTFKANIFAQIYNKNNQVNKQIRDEDRKHLIKHIREYLYPQVKLYFAVENLKQNEEGIHYHFLKNCLDKNTSRFTTFYKQIHNAQHKSKVKDHEHFSFLNRLELMEFDHYKKANKNYTAFNLRSLHRLNDITYTIRKLGYLITEASLNEVNLKQKELKAEIDEIIEFVEKKELNNIDHINFSIEFLSLLQETTLSFDSMILKNVYETLNELTPKEVYPEANKDVLYILILNTLKIRIFLGEDLHLNLFNLYKRLNKANKLIVDDEIDATTFKSVLSTACRTKNTKWAKIFYKENLKYVHKDQRQSIENFIKILFDYYEKKYQDVFEALNDEQNSLKNRINTNYEIAARIMKLKCLYEIETEIYHWNIIKTQRQFFIDTKYVNEKQKDYYLNFIRILENLLKIKNKDNIASKQGDANKQLRVSLEKIEKQLTCKDLVCDKPWIMEKVDELKNSQHK